MQAILGAGGTIGIFLAKELNEKNIALRLVSRNPKKVNEQDELMPTDLMDANAVKKAVENCEVAYLCAGLPYSLPVWQSMWPQIMQNCIDACASAGCKLVFFDNVYMYGKANGKELTEETPYQPCSEKGKVRAQIANQLIEATEKGKLQALIARAADFYGPQTPNGIFNMLVLQKLMDGKNAQWIMDATKKHTMTYTPDAAKCTAILGNDPSAYNQIWHVANDPNALDGEGFVQLAEELLGLPHKKIQVLGKTMMWLGGLFIKEVRESKEMTYQLTEEYLISSAKFEKAYGNIAKSYRQGLEQTIASMKAGK